MRSADPDRSTLRSFGLILGAMLLGLGCYLHWPPREGVALALAIAGGIILLAARLFPGLLRPIYGPWMAVGRVMGRVNAFILLTLLFFLLFTPLGLLMRLFGWDPLGRKLNRPATTYWVKREKGRDHAADLERLY